MRHLLLILPVLLMASPAEAFNLLQLKDPAFQQFAVIEIPLASMLLMGMADGIALYGMFRPQALSIYKLIWRMMRANLSAMLLNILLLGLLTLFLTKTITTTEYQLPVIVAVGYFMLVFAGIAWWRKSKAAHGLLGGASVKPKLLLALATLAEYGVLYWIIYRKLFAYPG